MPASRSLAVAALCALLTACASSPKEPAPPPGPQIAPPPSTQIAAQAPVTPRQRAEVHTDLAAGYYERGQFDVALEELGIAAQLDPTYPRIYTVYGLVHAMLNDGPKAEAAFGRALALAPDDSEARHNWGWYLCTHGRPAESIAEFELAIRNPLYRSPEIALVNAGKCSAAIERNAEAEAYFRRALQIQPANAGAAYNLALLSYKAGRVPETRGLMRVVMQQNSPPAEALFLGLCIERRLGDRAAEQSYATQLRNRYPQSAEAAAAAANAGCQ
jgi:type IV pilus assembly protein PilF